MNPDLARILASARCGSIPDGISTARALRELAAEVDRYRIGARLPLTDEDRRELRRMRDDRRVKLPGKVALAALMRHLGIDQSSSQSIPAVGARER
jgi:hypothetical protein